ncbi:hypothetical protein [Polluticoccus soli]|uniref:hypothetical protein n=1 Tax=Polluticoccus soli TaxID=3034150 RepID=UPI0023E18E72|nr:hypothetical protein [Flavipsychrobacter sp. JY13-12]
MKKNALFLALASVVLFTACKKEDPTPATPAYYFKAKIDGTLYEGSSISCNTLNNGASFSGMINYKGQQMALVVSQMAYSGPKTYRDSLMTTMALGSGTQGTYTNWQGLEPVTVNITSDNGTEVKADFSGKMRKYEDSTVVLNVTEGSLHMKWMGK